MDRPLAALVLGTAFVLAGCGGGADTGPPIPLVSGSLAGEFKGQPFTPMFGFAVLHNGSNLIVVGDGNLNCASPQQPEPPSGTNALFSVPALEVGTYSNRVVEILQNIGEYEGYGSNTGTITLTAVTETTVAGSIQYSYTNDVGEMFGISGTFEVTRCPN